MAKTLLTSQLTYGAAIITPSEQRLDEIQQTLNTYIQLLETPASHVPRRVLSTAVTSVASKIITFSPEAVAQI